MSADSPPVRPRVDPEEKVFDRGQGLEVVDIEGEQGEQQHEEVESRSD